MSDTNQNQWVELIRSAWKSRWGKFAVVLAAIIAMLGFIVIYWPSVKDMLGIASPVTPKDTTTTVVTPPDKPREGREGKKGGQQDSLPESFPGQRQTITISGKVIDKETREMLNGVDVFVDGVLKATTENGRYHFTIPDGKAIQWHIEIKKEGYKPDGTPHVRQSSTDLNYIIDNTFELTKL